MAGLLRGGERRLEHLRRRQALRIKLLGLFLRPGGKRLRPIGLHTLRKTANVGALGFEIVKLLGVVGFVHGAGQSFIFLADFDDDVLNVFGKLVEASLVDGQAVPGDRAEADFGIEFSDFEQFEIDPTRWEHDPAVVDAGLHRCIGIG